MVLNGNIIYALMTFSDRRLLYSDDANKFFADFAVTGEAKPDEIYTSKAAQLLQDIASADSATRHDAYVAINSAPFTSKDVPMLQNALFKQYLPISQYSDTTVINTRLATSLRIWQVKKLLPL